MISRQYSTMTIHIEISWTLTSGTFSLSVCDEAASVVTVLRAKGKKAFCCLTGKARDVRKARENIIARRNYN